MNISLSFFLGGGSFPILTPDPKCNLPEIIQFVKYTNHQSIKKKLKVKTLLFQSEVSVQEQGQYCKL